MEQANELDRHEQQQCNHGTKQVHYSQTRKRHLPVPLQLKVSYFLQRMANEGQALRPVFLPLLCVCKDFRPFVVVDNQSHS